MFEAVNKGSGGAFIKFSLFFTLIAIFFSSIGIFYSEDLIWNYIETDANETSGSADLPTVVIDAGHGGEDGGASTYGGAPEKELNLLIANDLKDMLEAVGINVVMTRTDDTLLYDKNSDYKGHKKSMDLANRLKIARETENAMLISIHMNAFPEEKYSGLQVYYSKNSQGSAELSKIIQDINKSVLSPSNNRKIKPAEKNIYLLDRFEGTAILIECGFLSNSAEREKLNTPEYRQELAACFFSATMQYIAKGGK